MQQCNKVLSFTKKANNFIAKLTKLFMFDISTAMCLYISQFTYYIL